MSANLGIRRVLTEVLAPLVKADGGEMYLTREGPNHVELHLAGRFAGCPGNTLVIRSFIERAMTTVKPGLKVTVTSGTLVPQGAERLC